MLLDFSAMEELLLWCPALSLTRGNMEKLQPYKDGAATLNSELYKPTRRTSQTLYLCWQAALVGFKEMMRYQIKQCSIGTSFPNGKLYLARKEIKMKGAINSWIHVQDLLSEILDGASEKQNNNDKAHFLNRASCALFSNSRNNTELVLLNIN